MSTGDSVNNRRPAPQTLFRKRKRAASRSKPPTYEVLEPKRLLANLSISSAFISDSVSDPQPVAPVEAQRVIFSTLYATENLAVDAKYDFEFRINGVRLELNNQSLGAGDASGSFQASESGWYVKPGSNVAEVWIDVNNRVAETDETDNYYTWTFTPDVPDLEMPFVWPFGQSHAVVENYLDVDPTSGILDHEGNPGWVSAPNLTMGPTTNQALDQGIPVFAAADGIVTSVTDGEPDRYTPGLQNLDVNTIRINHGGDWHTVISTLRRDSIRVSVGDQVEAGQLIGLMGGSIYQAKGHSSFLIYGNNAVINPFVAPNTYWETPPEYAFDEAAITQTWVTNYEDPNNHIAEGISEFRQYNELSLASPIVGAVATGVMQSDVIKFEWRKPNGELFFEQSTAAQSTQLVTVLKSTVALPAIGRELGRWRVEIKINGVLKGTQTFDVVDENVPEIRIEERNQLENNWTDIGPRLVVDGRYSPYDLGSVPLSGTSPQFLYSVVNHGTGALTISDLRVPAGFRIVEGLNAVIPAQTSESFTLELDTSIPGYRIGQVVITSNDPDEGKYTFSVEGAVVQPGSPFGDPGYFTIGMIERSVLEGERILVNVRVPESTSERQFNLSFDAAELTGPSSVTIPQGETQVSFYLDAIQDFIFDGDKIVTVTATHGLPGSETTASYELLVEDLGILVGTSGDDLVRVTIGNELVVDINGTIYNIPQEHNGFLIDGLGGSDRLQVFDSAGDEVVHLRPGGLHLDGVFEFMADDFETINLFSGGGDDQAFFAGSDQDDFFRSEYGRDSLTGPGFANSVSDYRSTYVDGLEGFDRARFLDSLGDDLLYQTPELTHLKSETQTVNAVNFESTVANSLRGGNDQAYLIGSSGADVHFATQEFTRLSGDGFVFLANGFQRMVTRMMGGADQARILGTFLDEAFFASPQYGAMRVGSSYVRVEGASNLTLVSGGGFNDTATLHDSPGDDIFYGTPTLAALYDSDFRIQANGFSFLTAISSGGFDRAILADSAGADRFVARPGSAWLTRGAAYFNYVVGFDEVIANSTQGNDVAVFYGSNGNDRFFGSQLQSNVRGDQFFNRASGFQNVSALMGQSGFDIGTFQDSIGNDTFTGIENKARLNGLGSWIFASDLDRVVAKSNLGGHDTLSTEALEYEFFSFGDWN